MKVLTTVYRRLALPPDEFSLSLLPLFTSEETSGITGENLHPGFYPFNVIEDLSLPNSSVDAMRVVQLLQNIRSVTSEDVQKGFDDDISIRLKIADGTMDKNIRAFAKKVALL